MHVLKAPFFLSDPSSVNLEKVSNILVDQSLKDSLFSKEAGRICYTIVQVRTDGSLVYFTFCSFSEYLQ